MLWINGKTSIKEDETKDPLKYVIGDPHLHAADLEKLGTDTYNQEVFFSLPLGRGLAKMAEKDK